MGLLLQMSLVRAADIFAGDTAGSAGDLINAPVVRVGYSPLSGLGTGPLDRPDSTVDTGLGRTTVARPGDEPEPPPL